MKNEICMTNFIAFKDFEWVENPWLAVSSKKAKGRYIRCIININQRTRIGLDLEDVDG